MLQVDFLCINKAGSTEKVLAGLLLRDSIILVPLDIRAKVDRRIEDSNL